MPSRTNREAVEAKLDQIESEIHRIGMWSDVAPSPSQFESQKAFFSDTMPFAQWLQFVFLPHAREAVAGTTPFPATSSVGAYAVREFDGFDEAHGLITLLSEFDQLICG